MDFLYTFLLVMDVVKASAYGDGEGPPEAQGLGYISPD